MANKKIEGILKLTKRIVTTENEPEKGCSKKYVCIAPEIDGRVRNLAIEKETSRFFFQDLTNQNHNEKDNRVSEATKDDEKPKNR